MTDCGSDRKESEGLMRFAIGVLVCLGVLAAAMVIAVLVIFL